MHDIRRASMFLAEARVDHGRSGKSDFNVAAHGLRGVASMMVFIAHVLGGTAEHIYMNDASYVALIQGPWNFGRWGVWLFFAISGFVILPSVMRYSPYQFALRRFFRIYPLFFAFSILFIILNSYTNSYSYLNDLKSIVAGLLLINLLVGTEQLTPNAWSLSYEALFYVMTCLIVHFTVRRPVFAVSAVLILAALLLVCRYPAMVFFLAGIGVRLLYDRNLIPAARYSRPVEIIALGACIIFASIEHFSFEIEDLSNPIAYILFMVTAIYFYASVSNDSITTYILNNRYILYLGTVSYTLYLLHPYGYYVFRMLFSKLGVFQESWIYSIPLFFVTVIPVTFIMTHYVYLILERYPYRWFFHERIYRA